MSSNVTNINSCLLWEDLKWPEVRPILEKVDDMVILPVGATEQHGKHLPLGVDTMTVQAIAKYAAEKTGIPLLPVLSYGCSYGHTSKWPGTLSLSPSTLTSIVTDIADWLRQSEVRKLAIINGHVGNYAPLKVALENIRYKYPEFLVRIISIWEISDDIERYYRSDANDFHANCAETSMMMALFPEKVNKSEIIDEVDRTEGCFFSYAMDKQSTYGVVGKPSQADGKDGEKYFALATSGLIGLLRAAIKEKIS